MPNPPDHPVTEPPETPAGYDALRHSALQTSGAILAAQRRAEQELLQAKQALEQRTAELGQSAQRYQAFLALSSEAVWRTEIEEPFSTELAEDEQIQRLYQFARLAECNRAMLQMHGFDRPDQVIGLRLGNLLPSLSPRNLDFLRAFIRGGYRVIDFGSHELHGGVDTRHFLNSLLGIVENGLLVRFWGVKRDVTERKQMEADLALNVQRLEQSEQQVRARNEELKGFAYTVSHDLKAPLRGIAGYGAELDRKHRAGLSERAQFCIGQILTATGNLDHLIEDLLHYSRLDAETPSLTDVNLRGLVEAILKDRALVIAEQHVELTVDLSFATLRTWERGLVQVLTNLIDNAIKYSRKAGPPRVGLRAGDLGHAWRFAVSDNGIGFDMKYHDRIFGLFNRLVRADEFEGTGAGLAIVKKVLDKMGGKLWAESAPGQGATFYVELPK